MNQKNYQNCNIKGHDDEFLNMICIDEKCKKNQLLCCYCVEEDHNKCQKLPISKFLKQFKQQHQSQMNDQEQNYESLEVPYNIIQSIIEKAQKKIIVTFFKQIDAIKNAKSTIQQLLKEQKSIKDQKQKLQEFESNMTQENCSSLLAEIVDFKPNSDRFSFTLKKIQGQKIDQIQDRILHGSKYSQQYEDFMKRFLEDFEKQHQDMEKNFQNFFLKAPQELQDLEQNNNNVKQSNMQSEIQINQIQVQDRQQNTIGINRNNTNINNIENNQSPKIKGKQTQNNFISPNNKQIQNSQMSSAQISNLTKQQSFSNSKQNNNQQSIEINQQSTPQFQQQLQQPIQQNTSKQFSSIGTLPNSHKEQLNPPSPNLQLLNVEFQNDNQIESEQLIDITQERSFQIESNGKKFTKILFLNNSMLVGCCGSEFLIFDLKTCKQLFQQTVGAYITDAVNINSNDLNEILYLAMNNGKVLVYKREQQMNQSLNFIQQKEQIVDTSGNLLIQINKKDNQLISFGEDKIIKIWQLNDFKEVKRWELNEAGTALHLDSEYIYVGGLKYLYIWNFTNQLKKIIKIQQTKIIYINTHLNKLVVGFQDKIKVFERTSNGDYQQKNEQIFESISSMNILKKWSIIIVSNTYQQQQQVCLYNYELCSLATLEEQIATCCTDGEFDNLNLLGFVYENGQFVVYRIQQSQR
ncbi:unnamed protein product [Paramecium primaurelia]|uniref:WD40-repeat-containing domain n=1 Tax=Paramecium primaurelia TaxID=5886 RepID=A0A8S1NZR5_PARPR|nr:unnamed protein product [Paramecium primaurelia]